MALYSEKEKGKRDRREDWVGKEKKERKEMQNMKYDQRDRRLRQKGNI